MNTTKEEAIEILEHLTNLVSDGDYQETFKMAASALHPITKEQVEKAWRGEWELYGAGKNGKGGIFHCTRCEKSYPYKCDFCPHCGAPMTDKAVDMVMERLNKMEEMKK